MWWRKENTNCTRKRKCKTQAVYEAEMLQASWADSAAPHDTGSNPHLSQTHTQGKAKVPVAHNTHGRVTRGSSFSEPPWNLFRDRRSLVSKFPPALMETCPNCAPQGRSWVPPTRLMLLQAEGQWVTPAPPPGHCQQPLLPVSFSTEWMLLHVEWWCFLIYLQWLNHFICSLARERTLRRGSFVHLDFIRAEH